MEEAAPTKNTVLVVGDSFCDVHAGGGGCSALEVLSRKIAAPKRRFYTYPYPKSPTTTVHKSWHIKQRTELVNHLVGRHVEDGGGVRGCVGG